MIPQDDHPEINFVGLLIGPRGNTLKNLEKDVSFKVFSFAVYVVFIPSHFGVYRCNDIAFSLVCRLVPR